MAEEGGLVLKTNRPDATVYFYNSKREAVSDMYVHLLSENIQKF